MLNLAMSPKSRSEGLSKQIVVSLDTRLAATVFAVLFLLGTALALVSLPFQLYNLRVPDSSGMDSLLNLVSLNRETSVPTWFSSKLLFMASLLLFCLYLLVRRSRPPEGRKWLGLSVIFLYLSVDEATVLHERIGGVFATEFALSGVLYYAWVLPFALLLLVFLAFYAPFFLKLPGRTRNLIALAGALYVGGAMGAEVIAALMDQSGDRETVAFIAMFTLEEWLEMTGVSLFIFALLDYAARSLYLRQAAAPAQPVRTQEVAVKQANPS